MSAKQLLIPTLALAGFWWLLSGGSTGSWLVGLPAIALALWLTRGGGPISAALPSPGGLLRFVPFFLRESVRGGLDVAARTLAPRLRIAPGLSTYRTGLSGNGARLLFANCVSLLPGTLAADLDGDLLRLHLLDAGLDPDPELRRLERAVARVFNEHLEPEQRLS